METRQQILLAIAKMDIMGEAPGFSIAGGQAYYCLSKEAGKEIVGKELRQKFVKTELWQEIVDTLTAVSKDRNAALASKAAAILSAKGQQE